MGPWPPLNDASSVYGGVRRLSDVQSSRERLNKSDAGS